MKRKIALGLAGVMMMSMFGGCGTAKSEYLVDVDYSKYVKLCDYKGVETEQVVYEITDEEIQEEIEMRLYEYATYEDVTDRGVEPGDYVVIDYTSRLEGEESEDYSGEEEEISVGEGYFYPEAEEALRGMKVGEKKTVEAVLTEDFAEEEDIGKKLEMELTVRSISKEELPEYNEKFVQEELAYDSIEEFEKSVREDLEAEKKEEYDGVSASGIMDFLMDNSAFNGYPQELYDHCEEMIDSEYASYASLFGMELEDFMEEWGIDGEAKKQEVESSVNYELIIGAIAQKEGINCTDKEIDEFVKENYAEYEYEDAESFLKDYDRKEIGSELIYEKVMDFLLQNAKFVEISEQEYLKREGEEEADMKE